MSYSKEKEEEVALYLGDRFENNDHIILFEDVTKKLGVDKEMLSRISDVLWDEGNNFTIDNITDKSGGIKNRFRLKSKIVQKAREIRAEREKEPDTFERIMRKARSHKVIAWLVFGFCVVSPVASLVISLIALFKD